MMTTISYRKLTGVLALSGLLLTACGGAPSETPGGSQTPSVQKEDKLHALLPESIKKSGKLKIATVAASPPYTFFDPSGKTIVGLDPDLGLAIGQKLGVSVEFVNLSSFDGLIPALVSNRFDMAMSDISDRPDRQEKVDFVDYGQAGSGVLVQAGNPKNIQGLEDLCGHSVALEKGTQAVGFVETQNAKCVADGKPTIEVNVYASADQADLQIRNGRSDASVRDYGIAKYMANGSNGATEVAPKQFNKVPIGIAVPKNNGQLLEALKGAVNALIQDGSYTKILEEWDVSDIAVTESVINGGTGKAS
jgi:polar amino acid transport system substrate-binding protein